MARYKNGVSDGRHFNSDETRQKKAESGRRSRVYRNEIPADVAEEVSAKKKADDVALEKRIAKVVAMAAQSGSLNRARVEYVYPIGKKLG